jgi:Bifunctional DNA primase/polymerase, N-terminal/Primase C terminal 1 (PriCT-1)
MLEHALALAGRGLHVFPCRVRDKHPATEHGFLDATVSPATIREWWSLIPDANIGLATGNVSGVFVVDIDSPEAETALHKLEAELGILPSTVESITGKGRHLFFRYPGDGIKCTQGVIAPGIDTRGDGGYVLAPPSVHPSGRKYCWSVDCSAAFADAPEWLIEKVSAAPGARAATSPEQWRDLAAGVSEGARNATVTRLAGYFLRKNVDPLMLLELLQGWNIGRCNPPLPAEDVHKIVDSICGRELKRRGHA